MSFCCRLNLFLNLSSLAQSATNVVQLSTANLTATDNFNLNYVGRVNGEGLLYAYAVGHTTNGEGLGDSAALLGDDSALEQLDSLLVALFDTVVNANGVTHVESGNFALQLLVSESLDQIHQVFLL